MKTNITLLASLTLFIACNSVPKTNNITAIAQYIKPEQIEEPYNGENISNKASISDSEFEILTKGKFNASDVSIDSTNAYGVGDCFGKVILYAQSNSGLATDSMSCGEYGYTNTHFLFDAKNVIKAVYVKQSESLLQSDGNWKYALSERLIDFKGSQAIMMEKADTLDDYTISNISEEFSVKNLKDRESTLRKWTKEYQELWQKEEIY